MNEWKLKKRSDAYISKYLSVYLDDIELPNGKFIEGYSVVKKPNIVVAVPITPLQELIYLNEYKYAANTRLFCLPAGHMKPDETAEDAAVRELREEIGMTTYSTIRICGILREYPTKDLHTVTVVRVDGIMCDGQTEHESTEDIYILKDTVAQVKTDITSGRWVSSSSIAALAVAGVIA